MSAQMNGAGSDFEAEFGSEDLLPQLREFPCFRGPRPRLRPPADAPPTPPLADALADHSPPPAALLRPEPFSAPPPLLHPADIEAAKERVKELVARLERRTLEDALEIGREALRIHRALAHGETGRWLKDSFGARRARTVYNWMGMAEYAERHPAEFATFAILDVSAVYLLTAPKTPRGAVEAVLRQIEAGAVPTFRTVRSEIALARQRADAPDIVAAHFITRDSLHETGMLQRVEAEILLPDASAEAPWDERRAAGLAALRLVAAFIPSDEREHAIGLLRNAADAQYGLADLIRSLCEAGGDAVARPGA
ncbi:MAG TPA: hypothetical protein VLV85_07725 [Stellaceae bacterium]|jgi:hypothetical protein|nr:hypothetical protein [Stellaceae bacterium]